MNQLLCYTISDIYIPPFPFVRLLLLLLHFSMNQSIKVSVDEEETGEKCFFRLSILAEAKTRNRNGKR